MRLLVTGANGMLARAVVFAAIRREHPITAPSRGELDVTDQTAVMAAIAAEQPQAIINCAAWTDVDGAESHEREALALNGHAPGLVAAAASAHGAQLIHLSTDYVFDGKSERPYVESDRPAPQTAYGRTKLVGEEAVLAVAPEHAVVRTAWLFGAGGPNFVATMLELAADGRDAVSVVSRAAPGLERARQRAPRSSAARALERRARGVPRQGSPQASAMRLLVCGGAGFIGSNFVRQRLATSDDEIVVLDKLTYAGRRESLRDIEADPRFSFIHGAIEDAAAVATAIDGADAVVNFAAETHVDRSISEPDAFVRTHALGTYVLLEAAREHGVRFLQISTDEVYGSIEQGSFSETSPLEPSSPYSATKAGADLLVAAYHRTFGLDALIARGSNNYGPYQYPEKLIPLIVLNALHGDRLPLYGDGGNVRNWLFVEDFASAIAHVLEQGVAGETYNVGGPDETDNLTVVRRIIELCGVDESLIDYVTDRPGHDRRYSLGSAKLAALGWSAQTRFAAGLERTVAWYRDNSWWWEPIRSGAYRDYYARQYGTTLAD
jgi:dTDP-glucose 4,6-dehydratase